MSSNKSQAHSANVLLAPQIAQLRRDPQPRAYTGSDRHEIEHHSDIHPQRAGLISARLQTPMQGPCVPTGHADRPWDIPAHQSLGQAPTVLQSLYLDTVKSHHAPQGLSYDQRRSQPPHTIGQYADQVSVPPSAYARHSQRYGGDHSRKPETTASPREVEDLPSTTQVRSGFPPRQFEPLRTQIEASTSRTKRRPRKRSFQEFRDEAKAQSRVPRGLDLYCLQCHGGKHRSRDCPKLEKKMGSDAYAILGDLHIDCDLSVRPETFKDVLGQVVSMVKNLGELRDFVVVRDKVMMETLNWIPEGRDKDGRGIANLEAIFASANLQVQRLYGKYEGACRIWWTKGVRPQYEEDYNEFVRGGKPFEEYLPSTFDKQIRNCALIRNQLQSRQPDSELVVDGDNLNKWKQVFEGHLDIYKEELDRLLASPYANLAQDLVFDTNMSSQPWHWMQPQVELGPDRWLPFLTFPSAAARFEGTRAPKKPMRQMKKPVSNIFKRVRITRSPSYRAPEEDHELFSKPHGE